ncbi:hypothetical protein AMECASPLE_031916 [Ameca splendens]|uniref:Uncharacterized protein n=1 Tax=Ameca splendens TaxID=208324 RepID=A0ABV0YHT0_9TELE
MDEKIALFESFLSCHVCSETFRDPVSLSCNHSFYSSYLQKFWEQTENKNCPICKRRSSKDFPPVMLTLKELADGFTVGQKSGSSETEKGEEQLMVVCSKHQEDPKLFCEDEQRALCPVCELTVRSPAGLRSSDRCGQTPGQPVLQSLGEDEGEGPLQSCHSGPKHCEWMAQGNTAGRWSWRSSKMDSGFGQGVCGAKGNQMYFTRIWVMVFTAS